MELSKEILNTIDGLADRFGLVIDWSKDNIYPQVADVAERFIHYKLACNWLWVGLGIVLIALGVWLLVPVVTEFIDLKIRLNKMESIYGRDIRRQFESGKWKKFGKRQLFQIYASYSTGINWVESVNEDRVMTRAVGSGAFIFVGIIMLAVFLPTLLQLYFVPELYILEWISNTIS